MRKSYVGIGPWVWLFSILAQNDLFIGDRVWFAFQSTARRPHLIRQLELIKPKVIVAFGTFAAQTGITVI